MDLLFLYECLLECADSDFVLLINMQIRDLNGGMPYAIIAALCTPIRLVRRSRWHRSPLAGDAFDLLR